MPAWSPATYWYACSDPERPGDEDCCYDPYCVWCIRKAVIDLSQDLVHGTRGWGDMSSPSPVANEHLPFPEFVAKAIAFHGISPNSVKVNEQVRP